MIGFRELFRGTLDGASVYPREVVEIALEHNAAAVILVHNHPSGDCQYSTEDVAVSKRLMDAGELIGIEVLDSLIVSQKDGVSLRELGVI